MSDFDEERIDIIGQNGATAEHYAQTDDLAKQWKIKLAESIIRFQEINNKADEEGRTLDSDELLEYMRLSFEIREMKDRLKQIKEVQQITGEEKIKQDPLNTQIGGDHYKSCPIQPVEYIEANKLAFIEGCIVKRVTRHKQAYGKR